MNTAKVMNIVVGLRKSTKKRKPLKICLKPGLRGHVEVKT